MEFESLLLQSGSFGLNFFDDNKSNLLAVNDQKIPLNYKNFSLTSPAVIIDYWLPPSSYNKNFYLETNNMKAPSDEKNLPFRKRLNRRRIPPQFEDSSQEIPRSDKTEEDLNLQEQTVYSHSSEDRTCLCRKCYQKVGDLPLLAQAIESEEASSTIESTIEELIPSTVESLPSTSSGYNYNIKKGVLTCPYCEKQFHHKGDMNKHLRIHTKEQPYSCKFCSKKFSHTSNLHRHYRIHTGDKPFSCTKCNKTFSRIDKLHLHQNSKNCKNKK